MSKIIDLVGQKFGHLFVQKLVKQNGRSCWLCMCDCGKTTTVLGSNLKNGHTQSCGCLQSRKASENKKDLTGLVFSRLTVISVAGKSNRNYVWTCLCECGSETSVTAGKLLSGHTRSCGCLWRESITKHGLHGKPGYTTYLLKDPVRKLKRYIGNRVRETMKNRNILKNGNIFDHLPYTVSDLMNHLESLWEPWMNWENYGGNLADPRKTWHIDHIVAQIHFSFTSMDDPAFRECWALSNLRPLEKLENCKKRCKDE